MADHTADQVINIPGVGDVAFPGSMNDADITAAAKRLHAESMYAANQAAAEAPTPREATPHGNGLFLSAASPLARGAQYVAEQVATHPGLLGAAKTVGAVGGGIAGLTHGGAYGAYGGALAGEKAGGVVGPVLQRLAGAGARVMETAAPYLQTLRPASGASGIGDLAQIAEPTRRDIGTFGIGPSVHVPGAHPPVVNAIVKELKDRITRVLTPASQADQLRRAAILRALQSETP